MKEAEGMDVLDRTSIREMQLRKLNHLLEREKKRVGFYKNLPTKLNNLEEFQNLPFTTEEDLRTHGNAMVLISQSQIERVRTQETSGTMGQAKRIYYSAKDNERTITFFRLAYPNWCIRVKRPSSACHFPVDGDLEN